ncbi:quinoprotein glucose dehydrogenase [Chitinispirillum alkaliphilum]|nr:quinoprotein glucose dehydrogenase [Chitinispirillum alkaliphilum]
MRLCRVVNVFTFTVLVLTTVLYSCNQEIWLENEGDYVVTNLEIPWAIDFLPSGEMIFTQRPGSVSIHAEGDIKIVGEIGVAHIGEGGLLGIAVDPDFEQNNHIFIYYTYQNGAFFNRISRFTLNDTLEEETIIIDSIPGAAIHNGGRIRFGPDGLLYATTGDADQPHLSGDTLSLAGKILRLEKDGSVPDDNPFDNYVYALGLRNPQGLAWRRDTLYVSSHGPVRRDEIHRVEKGMDYLWPLTCDETELAYRCYTDFTLAPSGIEIVDELLFVTGLRGNQLRRIDLGTGEEGALLTHLGRLRDVVHHNGSLYICTSNRDGRGIQGADDDKIVRFDILHLGEL